MHADFPEDGQQRDVGLTRACWRSYQQVTSLLESSLKDN